MSLWNMALMHIAIAFIFMILSAYRDINSKSEFSSEEITKSYLTLPAASDKDQHYRITILAKGAK